MSEATTTRSIAARVAAVKAKGIRLPHTSKVYNKPKDGKPATVRYTYTDSDTVTDDLRAKMAEEELDFICQEHKSKVVEGTNQWGKPVTFVHQWMNFWLTAPGEIDPKPSRTFLIHPYDGPQTSEAMVTYHVKMFLKARFQVSTGVDITQGTEDEARPSKPKEEKSQKRREDHPAWPLRQKIEKAINAATTIEAVSGIMDDIDGHPDEFNKLPKQWQAGLMTMLEAKRKEIENATT